jgi:xylulokinase
MPYLMGIDIGTTGARAIIIDEHGNVVGAATEEYSLHTPKPLWAEQNPEDWWESAKLAIGKAIAASNISGEKIGGIGLTGQMHGLVLLDSQGQVLRPAILWCDQRTQEQCDWITDRVGAARLVELTCNSALTGLTAPKILWVRRHEPEIYAKARKAVLPKDYLRFRLTGEYATEVSDASGTLLFDVTNRRWSKQLLQSLDIDEELLPEAHESPIVSGAVSSSAAAETGLRVGTPVVGGASDNAAGAVGNGIVRPGLISSTIGSSGVIFAFTEQPCVDPKGRIHTFCHAVPGKWHVTAVTLGAGLSLRWLRDELSQAERSVSSLTGTDPYVYLTEEAEQAPAGSEGLIYLPYMMGERTPHMDPNAKGVLFGLTTRHARAHVVRALLEGVAYSLRDGLEIMREIGVPTGEIRFSGGGARSVLWRQIQSDVFGMNGVTLNVGEGPSFGSALLAGVGTGVYANVEDACNATLGVVDRIAPIEENVRRYDDFYCIYCSLYPALKPLFPALAAAVRSHC